MNLNDLAAHAVKNNYTPATRTPIEELGIEEARARVVIRDGNKVKSEDGSQAIVLGFGKKVLPLDVIKEGSTRVNATAEQVEAFSAALAEGVKNGDFDEAIVAMQAEIKELKLNPPAKKEAVKADKVVPEPEAPAAVDLDALDDLDADLG